MPDRKLPVVYILLSPVRAAGKRYYGRIRLDASVAPTKNILCDFGYEWHRYEPAVPRCRTCSSFTVLPILYAGNERKAVCSRDNRWQPWYVPTDGSGFCHEHS